MIIMVVDPGETCGIAKFHLTKSLQIHHWADFAEPGGVYSYLRDETARPDWLVIEEFRLYPWAAQQQGFSELPTVEVIGVLKYLASNFNIPYTMQKAAIMKEGRQIAFDRGVPMKQRTIGTGRRKYWGWDFDFPGKPHRRDALAHGYYWLYRDPASPLYKEDK